MKETLLALAVVGTGSSTVYYLLKNDKSMATLLLLTFVMLGLYVK